MLLSGLPRGFGKTPDAILLQMTMTKFKAEKEDLIRHQVSAVSKDDSSASAGENDFSQSAVQPMNCTRYWS